jgi:asparagine synthase (glutamine-hydrolysing)
MCGILASFGSMVSETQFAKALAKEEHRGPDAPNCIEKFDNAILGHHRLAITDLNPRSNQPLSLPSSSYRIVFNGQIYNYKELKILHKLETTTESDTEVALSLYIKFGPRFLEMLNGDFSMVIYNSESREIFAARDRFGVKPLYFSIENSIQIIFSSEIPPILELINDRSFDEIAKRQFLTTRSFFSNHTPYRKVKSFPAGHYFLNGQFFRYWELEESEPAENWADLLEESVRLRKAGDVSIGTLLSGGVDSSLITAILRPKNTWTVGLSSENEFERAQDFSKYLGAENECVSVQPENFLDAAKLMIQKSGMPIAVPNEVLLGQLFKVVARTNKVVLSGEGADELFLGYDRIFRWSLTQTKLNYTDFANLYSYSQNPDMEIIDWLLEPYIHLKSPVRILEKFFQERHLHTLLSRMDRASMLNGVEARVPFVDHLLVKSIFGGSVEDRISNLESKIKLRHFATKYLPTDMATRSKVGFPVDLSQIFLDGGNDKYGQWLEWSYGEFEKIG